jgi:hypothetical protein
MRTGRAVVAFGHALAGVAHADSGRQAQELRVLAPAVEGPETARSRRAQLTAGARVAPAAGCSTHSTIIAAGTSSSSMKTLRGAQWPHCAS